MTDRNTVTEKMSTETAVVGNTVTVSTETAVVGNTVTVSTETAVVQRKRRENKSAAAETTDPSSYVSPPPCSVSRPSV